MNACFCLEWILVYVYTYLIELLAQPSSNHSTAFDTIPLKCKQLKLFVFKTVVYDRHFKIKCIYAESMNLLVD